jgi:DNA mismatch endonuclease (patch repair protein)
MTKKKLANSYRMSQIRGKDTKPEKKVRAHLFSTGLRYRKNVVSMPGKPDLVLKKHNAVIFIHGCFWHGHKNCKNFKYPKSHATFWKEKFDKNIANDKRNVRILRKLGWRVFIVWECQLKKKNTLDHLVNKILELE